MTFQPALAPLVLIAVVVIVVVARIAALRRLPPAGRTRVALWRWAGLTGAILLLVVAAARPVLERGDESATRVADRDAPNVFLVVDRSPDMRVTDQADGASRMSLARNDVGALIDRYPGARVAVISFAARPALDWPLSVDTWSLRPVTSTLVPYASAPDAVSQTNAGAAGNMLRYQLIGAVQQYPRAKNLVFYLGAGAAESEVPPRDFNLPEGAVDGGAVLGYGTAAGGPIPGTAVTRSPLDEPALRGVADQIGVPYLTRNGAEPLASVLPDDAAEVGASRPPSATDSAGRTELYWAPALLAAALVLVELYFVLREFRRTRLINADVDV